MRKSQADIITIILIVVISISLVGAGYLWLQPLIQKRQDTLKVEKLLKDFDQTDPDSLPKKIEHVAKTKSMVSFSVSSDGIWKLYLTGPENNSIEFSTFSKVSNIAIDKGWISLTPGGNCAIPSLTVKIGEPSSLVCVKAESVANGYILSYRVTFRELEETPESKYKIQLESLDKVESSGRMLILQFRGIEKIGATIVTKVQVLLS